MGGKGEQGGKQVARSPSGAMHKFATIPPLLPPIPVAPSHPPPSSTFTTSRLLLVCPFVSQALSGEKVVVQWVKELWLEPARCDQANLLII